MQERLIAQARALFAKQGYAATSQEEICQKSGVSRGALNHHFAGKRELFRAVVINVLDEFQGIAAHDNLEQGFRSYFHKALDPAVFKITIEDAPSVLGLQEWRSIESERFVKPLEKRGLSPLQARMVYGALLEATIAAQTEIDPETVVSETIGIVKMLIENLQKAAKS